MSRALAMRIDMSDERFFDRVSPLAAEAVPGRFGARRGKPGVTLSVRHPVSVVVSIIARKGQAEPASSALRVSFARGFWEWLTLQAEEMGYAVR